MTPWTVVCQAPLSMGLSRQEYWSGLPFLLQGNLPDLGIELRSPTLAGRFFTTVTPGKPTQHTNLCIISEFLSFLILSTIQPTSIYSPSVLKKLEEVKIIQNLPVLWFSILLLQDFESPVPLHLALNSDPSLFLSPTASCSSQNQISSVPHARLGWNSSS